MPGGAGVGWGSRFSPPAPLSPVKVNRASLPFPGLENIRSGLGGGRTKGRGPAWRCRFPLLQQSSKPQSQSHHDAAASALGPLTRDPGPGTQRQVPLWLAAQQAPVRQTSTRRQAEGRSQNQECSHSPAHLPTRH